MGPRALRGHGPHRYVFQLFALDNRLNFDNPPKLAELKKAMQGHVLSPRPPRRLLPARLIFFPQGATAEPLRISSVLTSVLVLSKAPLDS